MPSYLVPALYYSTNLSNVVLALLGPGFAMPCVFSALAASAVLTAGSDGSRPKPCEGRTKIFYEPTKKIQ